MFNAFQWNFFNLVYTCNIALILFLKCDVTKFRIPPPLSHNVTLRRPPPPLTCYVIYGWSLLTGFALVARWGWNVPEPTCASPPSRSTEPVIWNALYCTMIMLKILFHACGTCTQDSSINRLWPEPAGEDQLSLGKSALIFPQGLISHKICKTPLAFSHIPLGSSILGLICSDCPFRSIICFTFKLIAHYMSTVHDIQDL